MKNDSIAPEDGEYVQISLDAWRSLHLSLPLSLSIHVLPMVVLASCANFSDEIYAHSTLERSLSNKNQ